ncbi:pur operon repressor [Alicyclobacillus sp. ALC3]|uniref:pur operon repressor n=1 Tax=Alicyclobacillus sp. ALC3 TaxID=2796143 RepID=UPI002379EDEF|nr:pur operon repressor [Alicyclobacillus sp. ALC3]WDL98998.1 pur operon repressor [Alicyclobacillus sp. ALC3]
MQRSERFIRLVKTFVDQPNVALSLSELSDGLDTAKSSLSEDVARIRNVLEAYGAGSIRSIQGSAGGVKYVANVPENRRLAFFADLTRRLSDSSRTLPGGFLYMSDVLGDPDVLDVSGQLLATAYQDAGANVIVTVETKGIPLAVATARYLHLPLAIARRELRVTEGAALSIHYISGSQRRIQTMSLSKRAMPARARALIIDDFMRAGGTAAAVKNLLSEFSAEVVGTAVLLATSEPADKLVEDYRALFELDPIIEGQPVTVRTHSAWMSSDSGDGE